MWLPLKFEASVTLPIGLLWFPVGLFMSVLSILQLPKQERKAFWSRLGFLVVSSCFLMASFAFPTSDTALKAPRPGHPHGSIKTR